MYRRALLVVLILALFPAHASSQDPVIKDGDPGFHWGFPGVVDMFKGETRCYELAPANYGFISSCGAEDTFCVQVWNDLGWPMTNEFDGEAIILDAGYLQPGNVCITVPCEASTGSTVLAYAIMAYVDAAGVCQPDSGDCEDPNVYNDIPRWQVDTLAITVVESPPAIYILQDTLYYVEDRQSQAYVPFSICNGDPCSPPEPDSWSRPSWRRHGPRTRRRCPRTHNPPPRPVWS